MSRSFYFCSGAIAFVVAMINRHCRSYLGVLLASQVFLYQSVTLKQSLICLAIGLLCDRLLAINLIIRGSAKPNQV